MERVTVIGLFTVLCNELSTTPDTELELVPEQIDVRLRDPIFRLGKVLEATLADGGIDVKGDGDGDGGGGAVGGRRGGVAAAVGDVARDAADAVAKRVHKHEVSFAAIGSC